jgi:hypothetical protein
VAARDRPGNPRSFPSELTSQRDRDDPTAGSCQSAAQPGRTKGGPDADVNARAVLRAFARWPAARAAIGVGRGRPSAACGKGARPPISDGRRTVLGPRPTSPHERTAACRCRRQRYPRTGSSAVAPRAPGTRTVSGSPGLRARVGPMRSGRASAPPGCVPSPRGAPSSAAPRGPCRDASTGSRSGGVDRSTESGPPRDARFGL